MGAKRFIIGVVVGTLLLFFGGYLIFETLFGEFLGAQVGTATGVAREAPFFHLVAIGCATSAALICYVMSVSGRTGLAAGATIGGIVSLLLWLTADTLQFAFTNVTNGTYVIADSLLSAALGAITGAVIGLIDAKLKPAD